MMQLEFKLNDDTTVFMIDNHLDESFSIQLKRYDNEKLEYNKIILNFENEKEAFDFLQKVVSFMNLFQDKFYFLVSRYSK